MTFYTIFFKLAIPLKVESFHHGLRILKTKIPPLFKLSIQESHGKFNYPYENEIIANNIAVIFGTNTEALL